MILERKLNFAHHLANLPPDAIAGMVWKEQSERSLPGLYLEVKEHLDNMKVTNLQTISKRAFKKVSGKYIKQKDTSELLESVKKYKKLNYDDLSQSEMKRKNYFRNMDLESGRVAFRVASKMLPLPANFPSQYRRRGLSLACPSCSGPSSIRPTTLRTDMSDPAAPPTSPPPPPTLSQSHLLTTCPGVADIRADCNIFDEESVTLFFRRVVARSLEIEEFDNNQ